MVQSSRASLLGPKGVFQENAFFRPVRNIISPFNAQHLRLISACNANIVKLYTGMVGYVESLTDPSYRGQILVLSFPMIGNYGVPPPDRTPEGVPKYWESETIQVAGLVVADYSPNYSHWLAHSSLGEWLKKFNVPAIHCVDTRAIIKRLRDKGSLLGKLVMEDDQVRMHSV